MGLRIIGGALRGKKLYSARDMSIRLGAFRRHVGSRRINVPPGDRCRFVDLGTEEGVQRNTRRFGDRIEQRHLQTRSQAVVPHNVNRIPAEALSEHPIF